MYGADLNDEEIWQAWYPGWCHECRKQQPQVKSFGYYFGGKTDCAVCHEKMIQKAGVIAHECAESARAEAAKRIAAFNASLPSRRSEARGQDVKIGFLARLRRCFQ